MNATTQTSPIGLTVTFKYRFDIFNEFHSQWSILNSLPCVVFVSRQKQTEGKDKHNSKRIKKNSLKSRSGQMLLNIQICIYMHVNIYLYMYMYLYIVCWLSIDIDATSIKVEEDFCSNLAAVAFIWYKLMSQLGEKSFDFILQGKRSFIGALLIQYLTYKLSLMYIARVY